MDIKNCLWRKFVLSEAIVVFYILSPFACDEYRCTLTLWYTKEFQYSAINFRKSTFVFLPGMTPHFVPGKAIFDFKKCSFRSFFIFRKVIVTGSGWFRWLLLKQLIREFYALQMPRRSGALSIILALFWFMHTRFQASKGINLCLFLLPSSIRFEFPQCPRKLWPSFFLPIFSV